MHHEKSWDWFCKTFSFCAVLNDHTSKLIMAHDVDWWGLVKMTLIDDSTKTPKM